MFGDLKYSFNYISKYYTLRYLFYCTTVIVARWWNIGSTQKGRIMIFKKKNNENQLINELINHLTIITIQHVRKKTLCIRTK